FGYGLSYTTFAFDALEVIATNGNTDVTVRCRVTNTGDRRGAEVAQLYIGQPESLADTPVRELAGFERVELDPGESRVIEFRIRSNDLRTFDAGAGAWRIEPGEYSVSVGSSSRSLPLRSTFRIDVDPSPARAEVREP
ncbi:MAG: fibronectin type III-like domain-contianing protein, partial [Planctomycetota bacterium]